MLRPDFPAELIYREPQASALTALELGALCALAFAYWQGQALEMPTEDSTLAIMARCHQRRWYDCRDRVLPVWQVIRPRLATVYAERVRVLEAKGRGGRTARARERERRAAMPNESSDKLSDLGTVSAPLIPQPRTIQRESRTNQGDLIPKRALRGQKHALLSDAS